MRQAIAIINYTEATAKIAEGEDYHVPLPVLRSSPPLLCVNGEYYRYSQKEWEDAVAAAIVIYKAHMAWVVEKERDEFKIIQNIL